MECPQGMAGIKKEDCIFSKKCICGLIQAAWQYYKKAVEILKSSGFDGGSIDPCLYVKRIAKGIVYVALYVDDNLMIGNKAAIDDAILALKSKGLVLKVVEGIQDYLSCKIKISEDKKRAWLGQPHLIKNLKSKFKKLINDVWSHKTPGTPKFLIMRPTEDYEKISMEDQRIYCSCVGMLLYLVKHSQPDLANMTRELSKANNSANPAAYKELLRMIKYVIKTKKLGLKIDSKGNFNKPWKIIYFSDRDYAGDLVSR